MSSVGADDLTLVIATCVAVPGATSAPSYTTTNQRRISGWTNVRVSRGIERLPSSFEVSFTEPYAATTDVLVQPGDEVKVLLGADLVLSGFVDRYIPSISAREHSIRIEGRGKCQDLVDCSSAWKGLQFLNQPLLTIAQQLCAVYGVNVTLAPGADQGALIPQLNIMVGEPIYEVLETICRYRALLVYDQPDGSLLLSGIGTQHAASGFKEGVNVESATSMYSMDGRFSKYDAVRQGLDTLSDEGEGGNLISTVLDTTVPRFRYRAIVAESVAGGQDVAEQRANWEMVRRLGRSFQVHLVTDSWRDSAGKLWEPNTFVNIDLPSLKLVPKTWLISDVTYIRDARGTHAELVIMPPQAFYQEPIALFPIAPDIVKVQ